MYYKENGNHKVKKKRKTRDAYWDQTNTCPMHIKASGNDSKTEQASLLHNSYSTLGIQIFKTWGEKRTDAFLTLMNLL